ncbi:Ku protein [Gluconacetobacter johannae DSM 13595]|uniref:Non-homologous end joining protein Ku n=1 Tax=Gluconacetobacter johannae TaxID=112140 RepID=A0A7W4J443_9PROT|nr:Ku protein [Gluconacetobacter johannae]MBB2174363.1 Ku protein [Gluconacetobacter johannae]GBQ85155.1 Ku protein [Gluconacetobacter johannae DSM 13595]
MAQRPFWKGYLKLSLVTCPVAMTPATTESGKVRFHTINRKTGHRLRSQYVDAQTGAPVADDAQVMGYPRGEDGYVMLEDDELDAVALDSTHTIDIETFVPADSIGWVWYDTPHFLMPDDEIGEEAYRVIQAALVATGTVGISRLVMYRRERAVLLEARGKGIVLWTLHFGGEVRDAADYFTEGDAEGRHDPEMKLLKELIDRQKAPWTPKMVTDPVQDHLLDIIEARKKTRQRPRKPRAAGPAPGRVVNIMDALKASLEAESGRRR